VVLAVSSTGYSARLSECILSMRVLSTLMNGIVKVCSQIYCVLRATDERHSEFDRDHNSHWGKLHKAEDIKIEWHGEPKFYRGKGSRRLSPLQSLRMKRFLSYSTFSTTSYPPRWTRWKAFFRRPVPGTVFLVTIFVGKPEKPPK
jgi:hypothetical protein